MCTCVYIWLHEHVCTRVHMYASACGCASDGKEGVRRCLACPLRARAWLGAMLVPRGGNWGPCTSFPRSKAQARPTVSPGPGTRWEQDEWELGELREERTDAPLL